MLRFGAIQACRVEVLPLYFDFQSRAHVSARLKNNCRWDRGLGLAQIQNIPRARLRWKKITDDRGKTNSNYACLCRFWLLKVQCFYPPAITSTEESATTKGSTLYSERASSTMQTITETQSSSPSASSAVSAAHNCKKQRRPYPTDRDSSSSLGKFFSQAQNEFFLFKNMF